MKQYISENQLNEISEKKQRELLDVLIGKELSMNYAWIAVNIGAMIEFLGYDLENIWRDNVQDEWGIEIKYHKFAKQTEWFANEMCDALWEACKHKLYAQEKRKQT